MISSVASPICQKGKSERTFPIFAFSSRFFLFSPIFSWFSPLFLWIFSIFSWRLFRVNGVFFRGLDLPYSNCLHGVCPVATADFFWGGGIEGEKCLSEGAKIQNSWFLPFFPSEWGNRASNGGGGKFPSCPRPWCRHWTVPGSSQSPAPSFKEHFGRKRYPPNFAGGIHENRPMHV